MYISSTIMAAAMELRKNACKKKKKVLCRRYRLIAISIV